MLQRVFKVVLCAMALVIAASGTGRSNRAVSIVERADDGIGEYTVQLIDEPHLSPHCGMFAFESAMLFSVLASERREMIGDSVVIVFRCPEGHGPNFFARNGHYVVMMVKDPPDTGFGWTMLNSYAGLSLPTFWSVACDHRFFNGKK